MLFLAEKGPDHVLQSKQKGWTWVSTQELVFVTTKTEAKAYFFSIALLLTESAQAVFWLPIKDLLGLTALKMKVQIEFSKML